MILSSPWRPLVEPDPEKSYVALLGVLHLSGIRMLPAFVRFGVRIARQLRQTHGAIGYRTGVDVRRFGFYHLSVWTDSDAIQHFVDAGPHASAVEQLSGRLGVTAFRYWSVAGSELPLRFSGEMHRLQDRGATKGATQRP